MDMSFAIQALSAKYLSDHRQTLKNGPRLIPVPAEIDAEVAERKLRSWGVTIDRLTPEQHTYLYGE